MDCTSVSVQEAENRLLTVKQQIGKLKAWNKMQEIRLMRRIPYDDVPKSKSPNKELKERKQIPGQKHKFQLEKIMNEIEEQPLIPVHKDFQSLLNAKLKEESISVIEANKPTVTEKKKFLRKGEGLSRFRMKPEDFKLKKRNSTSATVRSPFRKSDKIHKSEADEYTLKENTALGAFELLEQQTNDSSFSSSSSLVAQLMEESIKSTPIKMSLKDCCNELSDNNLANVYEEFNFHGVRTLDIIDEEPSKFDDCSQNEENKNLVIFNLSDEKGEVDFDNYDGRTECSCCQDDNSFTAKSVSVFTEKTTTTVFSPSKREHTREIQFYEAAEKSSSLDNDENKLKTLLQSRLHELETEIDAFRSENSHLTKLRENYETEYDKFRDEKVQLLTKIRDEHLQSVLEVEEEKKRLHREKTAFEKYVKEIKSKLNKHEKEEIKLLKEEIKLLKEEINKKESRWAAAQARIRTEMKQMKDVNVALKDELRELKTKKVMFAPLSKKLKPKGKPRKAVEFQQSPEVITDFIYDTNELLQRLKFSDASYVDQVRSRTNYLEGPIHIDNRSVCVNSYADDTELEPVCCNTISISEATESCDQRGNIEKSYPDGSKEIWYPNGNIKKISPDGKIIKTIYYNGDVKEVLENDIVKYYYAENKIWHLEYTNGLRIMNFPNGQIEKHSKDGSLEIIYSNGNVYEINAKGEEKWKFMDGTVIENNKTTRKKRVLFPNGEIEVHTSEYKKREYPDGTVTTLYVDGRQETKYWNGRIRLKTKDGRLLSDSEVT